MYSNSLGYVLQTLPVASDLNYLCVVLLIYNKMSYGFYCNVFWELWEFLKKN